MLLKEIEVIGRQRRKELLDVLKEKRRILEIDRRKH